LKQVVIGYGDAGGISAISDSDREIVPQTLPQIENGTLG
jgi:hypothetical protein